MKSGMAKWHSPISDLPAYLMVARITQQSHLPVFLKLLEIEFEEKKENINVFECTESENTYKINGRNINSGPNSYCTSEIGNLDLLSVVTLLWFYIGRG